MTMLQLINKTIFFLLFIPLAVIIILCILLNFIGWNAEFVGDWVDDGLRDLWRGE